MKENFFELDGKTFNLENPRDKTDLEFEYKYLNKNEREWATEDFYKGTDEYEKINSDFDQKLEKFPDVIKASADDRTDVLEKLSFSDDREVVLAIAQNENTSAETLDRLSNDNDLKEVVANNSNASSETLEKLAADSNDSVREAVLDNPNASERAKDIAEKMNEIDSTPTAVSDAFADENKNTENIEVKEKSSLRM